MIRIESLGTISSNLYLTERIVVCNFLVFPPGATKKASSFSLALFTGTKIQPDRYFRLFEEIKDRTRRQLTDNRAPVCSAICARFSRHIISASYLLCVCVFVCLCVCFFSFSARLPWNPFYFLHLCLPLFLSLFYTDMLIHVTFINSNPDTAVSLRDFQGCQFTVPFLHITHNYTSRTPCGLHTTWLISDRGGLHRENKCEKWHGTWRDTILWSVFQNGCLQKTSKAFFFFFFVATLHLLSCCMSFLSQSSLLSHAAACCVALLSLRHNRTLSLLDIFPGSLKHHWALGTLSDRVFEQFTKASSNLALTVSGKIRAWIL